jgi:hypothetical protein
VDEHTQLGKWWRPENPRRRLFGVLRTKPNERITLDVAGDLAADDSTFTIVGRTQAGGAVTLLRCIPLTTRGWGAWTKNRDDVSSQDLLVHEALFGARFKSDDAARFRFTEVEYPDLPSLIGGRVLRMLPETEDGLSRSFGIESSRETELQVGDTQVRLVAGTSESFGGGKATFQAHGRLCFFSGTPRTLEQWYRDFIRPIDYLLSFALGKPCLLSRQIVLQHAPWWTYVKRHRRPPEIKVIRGETLGGPAKESRDRPLFSLSEDGVDLRAILPRWLEACARLELPLNIYFASIYAPFMYVQTRFLYLVQAAEGFHRARFAELAQSSNRKTRRVTLRNRLDELLSFCETQGLVVSEPDRLAFVANAVRARDNLSHGGLDPTRKDKPDYVALNQRLTLMMRMCLVTELDVSDEARLRILERLLSL